MNTCLLNAGSFLIVLATKIGGLFNSGGHVDKWRVVINGYSRYIY